MNQLEGCVALVTGGALGIGGGITRELAARGANVLIVDINAEAAKENLKSISDAGLTADFMEGDVAQPSVTKQMVEYAVSKWGRLDILVQNAYGPVVVDGKATDVSEPSFDLGISLLVKSLYLGGKFAVPAMVDSGPMPAGESVSNKDGFKVTYATDNLQNVGRIINISSVHGLLQSPKALIYETGKAAVIGLTRQMAIDFGPLGITSNAIAPGHIVTESGKKVWEQHGNEEAFRLFEIQYPVRRTGLPADIANAVAFLCSPDSSFITGVTLPVDGGLSIQLQENIVMDLVDYIKENPDIKCHYQQWRAEPRR